MRKWMKTLFVSGKQKANQAIDDASAKVGEIEDSIQHEIDQLEEECDLHRRLLKGLVSRSASTAGIMESTKRVNLLSRQLDMKRNLLANMHRERRQLAAVTMNTSVACAMRESLDAQKLLSMATCSNGEIDDVLDDVEDCRQDADELSDRLGATEEDVSVTDVSAFDMEQVRLALGVQPEETDRRLMHELHHLAQAAPDHDAPRTVSMPLPPPIWPHDLPSVPQRHEPVAEPRYTNWNF